MGVDRSRIDWVKLGKLGILFQLDPGSQKGKSFQQPLDIRIATSKFIQGKASATLGNSLANSPAVLLKWRSSSL